MAKDPRAQTLELTSGDTEYSINISAANFLTAKARNSGHELRMGFVTGQVASAAGAASQKYITIWAGSVYNNLNHNRNHKTTLYFASSTAGAIVEIETWDR
jgi:hypothetical protein